jgi:hypothetical protein
MSNFEVRKNETGKGWDVVDTRIGIYGVPVDYEHYKKDAIERCKLWNASGLVPAQSRMKG